MQQRLLLILVAATLAVALSAVPALAAPSANTPNDNANCLAQLADYGNQGGDWEPGQGGNLYVKGYAQDWRGVEEWRNHCYFPKP